MATRALPLIKGRRIRLTQLDSCGRPVFGARSSLVSSGFVSVALTANTVDIDEINVQNANGDRCIYVPGESQFAGYGVEITFCNIDPDGVALTTGNPVVRATASTTSDIIGFDTDTSVTPSSANFALEVWTGVAGQAACAAGTTTNYGYVLIPFIHGATLGDFSVQNDAVTFTISNGNTKDGNFWSTGPYKDVMTVSNAPAQLTTPLSSTAALRTILVDQAPPTANVGARPLTDPSLTGITAITASGTGMTRSFAPTPANLAQPFYYDYGDGTFDYIPSASMGAASHTFTTSGTYTVRAQTNGTWVSTTVTI